MGRGTSKTSGGKTIYHQFESDEDVERVLGSDYKAWAKSFNPSEPTYKDGQWSAINRYTLAEYNYFNEDLRSGKQLNELSDSAREMVQLLDAGINRFNLSTPIETYRQVRFTSKSDPKIIDKDGNLLVKQGQTITDKGFMSTTINRSEAGHIITNGTNQNSYILSLQTPKGKGVGAFLGNASARKYEEEFLFKRNTKYKITGKPYKDSAGYWVVPARVKND